MPRDLYEKKNISFQLKFPGNIFYFDSSKLSMIFYCYINKFARPRSAIGRAPDS